MKPPVRNLPASIHQRLMNYARAHEQPFNEVLQYYTIERFLYRLAESPYCERFVLKGALMFAVWGGPLTRPTRDIDLLGYTRNRLPRLVTICQNICRQPVEPDGLHFDPDSVSGLRIKEHAQYSGVRLELTAYLGNAQIPLRLDIAFADAVVPAPETLAYPTLLDMPAPRLRSYPRETVVAEKLEAMVVLGSINSRMKDFYDLWLLARQFDFAGSLLLDAITATFSRRKTDLPQEIPNALTDDFARAKQTQWAAFRRTARLDAAPQDFVSVSADLRAFLLPLLDAAAGGTPMSQDWVAPGPWR